MRILDVGDNYYDTENLFPIDVDGNSVFESNLKDRARKY